jgi:hypothetical protein
MRAAYVYCLVDDAIKGWFSARGDLARLWPKSTAGRPIVATTAITAPLLLPTDS